LTAAAFAVLVAIPLADAAFAAAASSAFFNANISSCFALASASAFSLASSASFLALSSCSLSAFGLSHLFPGLGGTGGHPPAGIEPL
jgi:hypothetical protein